MVDLKRNKNVFPVPAFWRSNELPGNELVELVDAGSIWIINNKIARTIKIKSGVIVKASSLVHIGRGIHRYYRFYIG